MGDFAALTGNDLNLVDLSDTNLQFCEQHTTEGHQPVKESDGGTGR